MTLRKVFTYPRSPPILNFVLGWSDNCVEFRFGHIQSVTVLQYMVSKIAIIQSIAPPPHQQYSFIYTIQFFCYYLKIQWCCTAL